MALTAVRRLGNLSDLTGQFLCIGVVGVIILAVARPVLDFRIREFSGSTILGVLIFALWIAPDLVFPGYRHSPLFENAIMGRVASSLSSEARGSGLVLALRSVRAVVIVPIVEELFWRGWLQRWLIKGDFEKVPLGVYSAFSFWTVAVLFASEHGPYWDVGLASGVLFNAWIIRTRSLGDLIFCHTVANACLCTYVIATGKWEYWL